MVGHVVAVHSCGVADMPRLQACFRVDDQRLCGPSRVCLQGSAAGAYPAGAHDLWQAVLSLPEYHTIYQHCWYVLAVEATQICKCLAYKGDFCYRCGSCNNAGLSKQQYLMAA